MYPNTTARQVKCGHCSRFGTKVYHDTIDQVRACSQGASKPQPTKATRSAAPVKIVNPATQNQIQYIKDLAEKRDWSNISPITKVVIQHVLDGGEINYKDARTVLDQMTILLPKPREEQPAPAPTSMAAELFEMLDQVPNGGYAVEVDGKTHFYVVKNVRTPSGRKYRTVRERASDTLHKMYKNQQVAALRAVLEVGLEEARTTYSTKLGACWKCCRSLTDDTGNPYRVYGLGPDCGPKVMG